MAQIAPWALLQFDNHLGTACVETDETGAVISYEEYHPYGTSSYRSWKSGVEVSAKRYRYTGKERDEETSLYYHGARYYAPWLGRWMSADPAGTVDGTNLFAYVRGSPIRFSDPNGMWKWPWEREHLETVGPQVRRDAHRAEVRARTGSKAPPATPPAPGQAEGFFKRYAKNAAALAEAGFELAAEASPLRFDEKTGETTLRTGPGLDELGREFVERRQRRGGGVAGSIHAINEMANPVTIGGQALEKGFEAAQSGKRKEAAKQFATALGTLGPLAHTLKPRVGSGPGRPSPSPQGAAAAAGVGVSVSVTPGAGIVSGVVAMSVGDGGDGPKQSSSEPKITVEDGSIRIRAEAGTIQARYNKATGDLHIDDVAASKKGVGYGTELYDLVLQEAEKLGEVKSVSGYMATDNRRALLKAGGDISATPRARILDKFGFTEHSYNPATRKAVSRRPN